MPSIDINFAALAVAVVINMVLGFVWYSKQVFGKPWQRMNGLGDKDRPKEITPMITMLILAFIELFVLLHFVSYSAYFYPEYSSSLVGLLTGLWVWIGFVFPVMAGGYMFAERRKKLLAIDSGYHLVVLVLAGILLAVWK